MLSIKYVSREGGMTQGRGDGPFPTYVLYGEHPDTSKAKPLSYVTSPKQQEKIKLVLSILNGLSYANPFIS